MKKAPGILPSPGWLQTHGWRGLDMMMRKYPQDYLHIRQTSNKGKSPKEWQTVAETLAKKRGTLPTTSWLYANGYSGLTRAMREQPRLFTHIKQDRDLRRPEEWVTIAEQLAAENHGRLPCVSRLEKSEFVGLVRAMAAHPDLFSHIKLDYKGGKKPMEWIKIAEGLAHEHGCLPDGAWLRKNGFGPMVQSMYIHPDLYAHIPKAERTWRTAKEWVPIAEALAKKHGNCLPSRRWLDKNGYEGLRGAKGRRPELFVHIKQHGKGKSPEEWAALAKVLVTTHGKLPCNSWLNKNGYSGLDHARRNRPDLFNGIEQERKGRRPHEWVSVAEELASKYDGLPSTTWLNANGFNALVQMKTKHKGLFAHIARRATRL